MKIGIRVLASISLVVLLGFSLPVGSHALDNFEHSDLDSNINTLDMENVTSGEEFAQKMEEYLQKKGTTLDDDIKNFLKKEFENGYISYEEYNEYLAREKSFEEREALYNKVGFGEDNLTRNVGDTNLVKLAISYFNNMNYDFSAHLLSRGLYGRNSSEYQPSNERKSFLYNTVAYNSLKRKDKYPDGSHRGDCYFQNKFNRDEADAYYSIHQFTADMTYNRVKITDYYDYSDKNNYPTPVSTVVSAIVRLHNSGEFTYYPLRIHLIR